MHSEQLGSTRSICTGNAGRSSLNELDPIVLRTQDGKDSEKTVSTDSRIRLEFGDRSYEAEAEAFTPALIYGGEAKQVRDSRLADECVNSLFVGPAIQALLRDSDRPAAGVAQTLRMEECDYTSDYRAMVHDKDDRDVEIVKAFREATKPRARSSTTTDGFHGAANTNEYHVGGKLLRFVFEHEGHPLNDANDSAGVLEAVTQWIDALRTLDKVGAFHRSISFGNLLSPKPDSSEEGRQAITIEVSLAHLKPRSEDYELYDRPQEASGCPAKTGEGKTTAMRQRDRPHHHVTGTLPFIALDLVSQLRKTSKERIQHTLHHDVESIFWVVVYLCLRFGGETVNPFVKKALTNLWSSEIRDVLQEKTHLLVNYSDELLDIGGRFAALGEFLKDFADYYNQQKSIEASDVRDLAAKHRDILKRAKESAQLDTEAVILPPQPRTPPKSLDNSGGSYPKRTYSVREGERQMSNVEEEVRLQNEDEGFGSGESREEAQGG